MSRSTPPGAALTRGTGNLSGTKAATPHDASGLFHTLQSHVDEIRGLLQCGICIRPLYEPFTLACGHTFCYGCLSSWFAEGRSQNKTCPDCRAPVKSQPAPAYLVRAVVQLFTSRAELLDKGETTDQHKTHQLEEAQKLETDKKNTNPREGGLFRGIFDKGHQPSQPIIDVEDGVVRCPECSWELDGMGCLNCGYRHDDDSMSGTDYTDENSEMTDDIYDVVDEDLEDGFGEAEGFDWAEWYDGVPLEAIPPQLYGFGPADWLRHRHVHHHVHNDEDDEDEEEDEDMDSFIDDDEPSENYDSDSDRSTIVGHLDYSREELHAIFDESSSSGYSTARSNVYYFNAVPDGEEDEGEDEDEHEHEYGFDSDSDSDDDDDVEDEDEDDEPIRPPVTGNRRRIPTYHILSSSSPLHPNGETPRNVGINGANPHAPRGLEQPPPAGSSAARAITLDDDSDEGPVGPTRRARPAGWCRDSGL